MSSSSLLFRDHKAYLVRNQWDGKNRRYIYDEREVDSVSTYLTLNTEIGRNFTFGDLLAFVEKDAAFYNDVFAGTLGFFDLHAYLSDSKPPKKAKTGKQGIHRLVIGWQAELHDGNEENQEDPTFSIWADFIGLGPSKCEVTKKIIPDQRWSLSFSRMNELVNYPISLNSDFTISHWTYEKDKNGKRNPKIEHRKTGTQPFSLFKILEAIFHEISFFGDPGQRDKQNKQIEKQVKEAKKWSKGGVTKDGRNKKTGKKLWYSMEEVMSDFERRRKTEAKKAAEKAPALLKQYSALLKQYKDSEALPVKKFFMENRGNTQFVAEAEKLKKKYEVINV